MRYVIYIYHHLLVRCLVHIYIFLSPFAFTFKGRYISAVVVCFLLFITHPSSIELGLFVGLRATAVITQERSWKVHGIYSKISRTLRVENVEV